MFDEEEEKRTGLEPDVEMPDAYRRRPAVDPPDTNTHLRRIWEDVPEEVRRLIANSINDAIQADGGLSEESVANGTLTAAIIHNLHNLKHPQVEVVLSDQTTLVSSITDYFVAQFDDASNDDTGTSVGDRFLEAVRNDLAMQEAATRQPGSNSFQDMSSGQSRMVESHQFSDATEAQSDPLLQREVASAGSSLIDMSTVADSTFLDDSTTAPLLGKVTVGCCRVDSTNVPSASSESQAPRTQSSSRGKYFPRGCGWFVFGAIFLVLVAVAYYFIPDGHLNRHGNRRDEVLRCGNALSQLDISKDAIRWKVAQYFITGGGEKIATAYCDVQNSLFSVMYGLMVMRESVSISTPSWYDKTTVITSPFDVCNHWKRVQCTGATISGLSLNSADLAGTVPLEVSWLRELTVLEVFSNGNLTGTIPTEVGLMTHLKTLKIHKTSLEGTIPTELGALTSLEEFDLYGTHLSGIMPSEICQLKLPHLTASCNGGEYSIQCDCCTHCVTPTAAGKSFPAAIE